jgi:hypothetical protein
MKKGVWIAQLVGYREELQAVDKYFVGLFETAQEAFIAGSSFRDPGAWEEYDKPIPDKLAIELLKFGTYPENIEEQFLSPYAKGAGYLDVWGICRGSYMIQQNEATI